MGIFIHGGHIHFPSGTAESNFLFFIPQLCWFFPLNISALRKITNINFLIIFLLAACSASIILADPAAIFKPWQRLVYFHSPPLDNQPSGFIKAIGYIPHPSL